MAFEIVASKSFRKNILDVHEYLKKKWSVKVADEFLDKVQNVVDALSITPTSGSLSEKRKNIRKFSVTRQNTIYYKIRGRKVFILSLFDTRKNPKRNKYE